MPRGATSGNSQGRWRFLPGRSLAPSHAGRRTLVALSLAGSLASAALVFAASKSASTNLVLVVREEEQLQLQGGSVVLKIRLAPGVTARLWGDQACGTPIQTAMVIAESGTYTLPFDNIPYEQRAYLCLLSSDSTLRGSMVWPAAGITTTIPSRAPAPTGGRLVVVAEP
jgi:hypothetical protein